MPRQARKTSGTGIYHVMLRGINRQDIFEDDEDYMQFLRSLHQLVECYDERGYRIPSLSQQMTMAASWKWTMSLPAQYQMQE